jgi:hypothetical protein
MERQRDGKQPPEIVVGFDEEDGAWGLRHRPGYLGRRFRGRSGGSEGGRDSSSASDSGGGWSACRS